MVPVWGLSLVHSFCYSHCPILISRESFLLSFFQKNLQKSLGFAMACGTLWLPASSPIQLVPALQPSVRPCSPPGTLPRLVPTRAPLCQASAHVPFSRAFPDALYLNGTNPPESHAIAKGHLSS